MSKEMWAVLTAEETDGNSRQAHRCIVDPRPGGRTVAQLICVAPPGTAEGDQAEREAALLARAPRLRDALMAMLSMATQRNLGRNDPDAEGVLNIARRALLGVI